MGAFFFSCMNGQIKGQDLSTVPGVIIAHQPASSKQYIGSPSIAVLPNGDYVVSHDFFGPNSSEFVQAISRIYRSSDKGKSWQQISEIRGAFWSSLFVHREVLYLLGPDRHHGTVLIRKSEDGGVTWSQPSNRENGLLLAGEFHCAPMPVIEHNGRLWRAMETAHGPILQWGKRYGAMMMSAPVNADLLQADSWTTSNFLPYDSTYLEGHFTGWLEGNAVVAPDGNMVDILRVDDRTTMDEKAAIVKISADGKIASFDPTTGFVSFPGGSKKFAIRFDDKSKRYWTLSNIIPQEFRQQYPGRNAASFRNTLALMSSSDLMNWQVHHIVLQHPDVLNHGFQYVDWLFEDNDMIVACRTAYDDKEGGAHNNHDANFLTFHRITDFRKHLLSNLSK
ncbi:sialidase family protein [Olivibacter sitiensis]|uniref:sialidase family protein n=1 Tax=Olivibacter sitiensis TaxID=376470 RepID=UPI0003FB20D0|nr:sialidase family protein [Olivibacter sitiensis]